MSKTNIIPAFNMTFFRNLKFFRKILTRKEKSHLILIYLFSIIGSFLEIISLVSVPAYIFFILEPSKIINLSNKYDLDLQISELTQNELIIFGSIIIILAFIIKNLFLYFLFYYNGNYTRKISIRLSNKLFLNYIYADLPFYFKKNTADLIRNLNMVRRVTGIIGNYINLFLEFVLLALIITISLQVQFKITLLAFTFFGIIILIYFYFFNPWFAKAGRKHQVFQRDFLKIAAETFASIKEIRINLKENYIFNIFEKKIIDISKLNLFTTLFKKIPRFSLEILGVIFVCVMSITFLAMSYDESVMLASLSFIVVASVRLIPSFNTIAVSLSSIRNLEPSLELIDHQLEYFKNQKKYNLKSQNNIYFDFNKLELKNINFHYEDHDMLFEKLNLEFFKGEKIGIIGKSGIGKTSLVNIITGLYQPSDGSVRVDDIEIAKNLQNYYGIISYVAQDCFLSDDTIKNNIIFGSNKNLNEKNLKDILKITELENLIQGLENKENTIIGERGLNISGGQRQRIGIARALFKNPKILILDEATNALDVETEEKILKKILSIYNQSLIMIITHRRKTLQLCDKILEIKNKSVIEI